jgi:uroporphyrinogen-III synthase
MEEQGIEFTEAVMYHTVNADLSDLASVYYDVLVFYSPQDIVSLFANFPKFKQEKRAIAGWGKTTDQAIAEAGLTNTIPAPTAEHPSMVSAIEQFIKS